MAKPDVVILNQNEWLRKLTIRAVKSVNDEQAEIIPEGFKNNIKWNLGHIYLDQYAWLQTLSGEKMPYPKEFPKLFNYKTDPTQWETEPPTMEELIHLLSEQPNVIREKFHDRLDDKFPKKSGMQTVRQVLVRTLMHESMHLHTIKAYKILMKTKKKKK